MGCGSRVCELVEEREVRLAVELECGALLSTLDEVLVEGVPDEELVSGPDRERIDS